MSKTMTNDTAAVQAGDNESDCVTPAAQWWSSLSEPRRAYWLRQTDSGSVAEAYAVYRHRNWWRGADTVCGGVQPLDGWTRLSRAAAMQRLAERAPNLPEPLLRVAAWFLADAAVTADSLLILADVLRETEREHADTVQSALRVGFILGATILEDEARLRAWRGPARDRSSGGAA